MGYIGRDNIIQMKYDLHIHSKYSVKCGISDPKDIIKYSIKKGLGGIAITDHDTIKGGLEAKKYETDVIEIIVGCELNTAHGEIIGLFLTEEIKSRDVDEAIDEIHSQGGLVIIPHPFDSLRNSFKNLKDYVEKIDAIEGFNSRCIFDRYNKRAVTFAKDHNIPIVAGSDAHYPNEIGLAGVIASNNSKEGIINNLDIFHNKSSLLNHFKTKNHKLLKSFNSIYRYEQQLCD